MRRSGLVHAREENIEKLRESSRGERAGSSVRVNLDSGRSAAFQLDPRKHVVEARGELTSNNLEPSSALDSLSFFSFSSFPHLELLLLRRAHQYQV